MSPEPRSFYTEVIIGMSPHFTDNRTKSIGLPQT